MTTPVTESVGGLLAQSGTTKPTTSKLDRDTFLTLMVAQLRNQDPMNPTDSAEFLAQTAQFTSLEKLEEVSSQTAQVVAAQMAFGASSLVGRTVSYAGPDGAPLKGKVDSVRFTADGPVLEVNGSDVPLANMSAVTETGAVATPTPVTAS